MKLRKLELNDAPDMLEWMHNATIVKELYTDFSAKSLSDCEKFINLCNDDENPDIYRAIVSDEDEYMGMVSLKYIHDFSAELAIAVRQEAMGRGYAWFGMEEMIRIAFEKKGLESVYWCVSRKNQRAIRFYDKHNFHEVVDIPNEIKERYEGYGDLKWYSVLKGDELNSREFVAGCKVIHINTIPTVNAGELSFFEATHEIPFEIKRVYYISKVPEGVRRGFHAHKKLKQLIFCPYGRVQLILENKDVREEIELSDPSIGILIEEMTWREMLWIQKDSVLCVATSEFYDEDDYIRDYNEFRLSIENKNIIL